MGSHLELYEARLSYLRLDSEPAECHFSYAHIHKTRGMPPRDTGRGWSQEAVLLMEDASLVTDRPSLPNTIVDGYLEAVGTRHEPLPLPFERSGAARLYLRFADDSSLELRGNNPTIKLLGEKVFLQDYL